MNNKKLLILGAGQYGRVVRETAEAMGCFEQIAFLDDNSPAAIGKLEQYPKFADQFGSAFVAMGNPQLRLRWLNDLKEAGFVLPALIHPRAYVSPSAKLECGVIVEAMAVVNSEAVVRCGGLICAGAVVNHNSTVETCCQIDCNAVVAANAVVPEGRKIPSGTVFERKM